MPLDKFKKTLGNVAGAAGEKAKSVGGVVADKAAEAGGFVAGKAAVGKEMAAQAGMEARLRHYSPIFRDDYFDPEFDLPEIVVIVDGDQRKGIDVCEGAIGWLSKHKGTEVLHMYQEFVDESGLSFHPKPQHDAVYHVDTFDPVRFINLNDIFSTAHSDRITELRNIAYSLGAKSCKLESYESRKETTARKVKQAVRADKRVARASAGLETSTAEQNTQFEDINLVFEQLFSGSDKPQVPELKWFASDREVQSLIDMRCAEDGANEIGIYRTQLEQSSSSTMDIQRANKIDGVLKDLKISLKTTMESKCKAEARKRLCLTIEF